MATQLHIRFDEAVGWIIAGNEDGPAGTLSLPLGGIRVTVDAVDVRRLVEVTVFTEDRSAPIGAAVLDVCQRLLGGAVADVLASRPAGPMSVTVQEPAGPLWEQVANAALAWFLWTHDTSAPRLAALRFVAASWPLATLGTAGLITARAWDALPAVIALGRFAARHSAIVDRLSSRSRSDLVNALTLLTEVLTADQWDGTGAGPIRDLRLLLSRVSDADIADLLQGPGEKAEEDEADSQRIPEFTAGSQQQVSVHWRAVSQDLQPRLGDFADEAFAGATARGRLPGYLDVQVPLRAGLCVEDAPQLVARVHAWSGELLGQAALRISALPGELPRASNRVQVRLPELPAERERLLRDGVHVDIAVAGLPPLSVAGLRREACAKARRAGVRALVDRHAGDLRSEAEAWVLCARLYLLGGDAAKAAIAQEQARTVTGQALLSEPAWWPEGVDWASDLLAAWRTASREALQNAGTEPPPDRITLLRQVVRDLSAGANGVPELAQACENLARTLLKSGASDGTAAGKAVTASAMVEANEAAAALLREALRVRYLLGERPEAEDVAAQLAAVGDDADAAGRAGDDTDG